ncbi:MAG: hypothetical protein ACRD2Z_03555 [Thermoanaerobaculia bacterium]
MTHRRAEKLCKMVEVILALGEEEPVIEETLDRATLGGVQNLPAPQHPAQ